MPGACDDSHDKCTEMGLCLGAYWQAVPIITQHTKFGPKSVLSTNMASVIKSQKQHYREIHFEVMG